MNWKIKCGSLCTSLLLVIAVFVGLLFTISTGGCRKSSVPTKVEWGKKGVEPTRVWQDYDWLIISQEAIRK
jgi:hypothetical protein